MKSKKKLTASDLRRQAEAMVAAETMPSLEAVLKAITEVRAELNQISAADILFLKSCGIATEETPNHGVSTDDARYELDGDAISGPTGFADPEGAL
jgi:hypothetical protein